MMSRSVYIVGPSVGYRRMFFDNGWKIVDSMVHADLVQFTGGSDVSPEMYGEKPHPTTFSNPERDQKEILFFKNALKANIPMAGICRGGQFLNVMNGGRMWQNVNNHALAGTHSCIDLFTGDVFQVTSTHHQMMIPAKKGAVLIGIAAECTSRERMVTLRKGDTKPLTVLGKSDKDVEIVFYPKTKSFCFQPHPEFSGHDDMTSRYFDYIEEYLFNTGE